MKQGRTPTLQTTLINALDALRHCASDDDRWACGANILRDCGSDWITAGTAARSTGAALAVRSTTPDALMRDYVDQRLHLHDPWMQICAASTALDSLDVDHETTAPSRRDKLQMSRLFSDHGVRRAVLVPCYSGHRTGGIVLYARSATAAGWLGQPSGLDQARLLVAVLSSQYRPERDRSQTTQLYCLGHPLSAREREVLQWLSTGCRTARIAERMRIEEVTVTKHLLSVRRKLGARTREQALAIALRDGLISV